MARWPYNTKAWRQTRRAIIADEPLCRMCAQVGQTTAAQVVDHIERVADAPDKAFDPDNLQPLCKSCHDRFKQAQERGRGLRGAGLDGLPLDPTHHWRVG